MSGGFFRGTSADQDTRFSNKQAKLLKSQKFPPELDHLVDMTKVKMDVIRPWIATRVTELLGFDDEVLINFIFELLEGKVVDGKQIQIQLTGFMEKNTGKFMRELWGLLLSAQNNVSGVPQQFLDAKEEETRKKKEETDRIAGEIQKRRDRDGRESERARMSRFEGEADGLKFTKPPSDLVSKFSKPRESSMQPEENREVDGRGSTAKNRHSRSPHPNDRSTSPRISQSPTRSNNKSISRSRSHSEERQKSRSLFVSSQSPRHSVSPLRHDQSPDRRSLSPKRRYRSPLKRSLSPRRRHSPGDTRSPLRRRSPHLRRSPRSRHKSPSPFRYRSPLARRRSPRRRSRSPLRRRSPSPLRRRSPSPRRQRSPFPLRRRSPMRRRSPFRGRSPSPSRHRSPLKARRRSPSPLRRRSPIQDRPMSPARGMSPSPLRRRSPPPRSPKNRRGSPLQPPKNRTADSPISPPQRKRSHSPYRSQSPAHRNHRSLSREHDSRANGNESGRYRVEQTPRRVDVKKSPVNNALDRELAGRSGSKHKVPESLSRKLPISLRSPQRDMGNQSGNRKKIQVVSPENSPSQSDSPTDKQKVNPRTSRRSRSLSKSPVRQTNIRMPRHDSPATSKEEQHMTRAREVSRHRTDSSRKRSKDSPRAVSPGSYMPDRREFSNSPAASGLPLHPELKKKDIRQESDIGLPKRRAQQLTISSEEIEYAPGRVMGERGSQGHIHDGQRSAKLLKADASLDKKECNEQTVDDERRHRRGDEYSELHRRTESITRSKKKMDKKSRLDTRDSDSEETNSYGNENIEKKRHKKSDKRKRDYGESSDSDSVIEDKKEAKRRRKDEKRLRKEEKRRRREERHRRKLERRAGKMKGKSIDTVSPPSDFDMDHSDAGDSDGGAGRRKNFHPIDAEEAETEQKKLEIELREKALESLRAKKAISH